MHCNGSTRSNPEKSSLNSTMISETSFALSQFFSEIKNVHKNSVSSMLLKKLLGRKELRTILNVAKTSNFCYPIFATFGQTFVKDTKKKIQNELNHSTHINNSEWDNSSACSKNIEK